MSYRSEDDLDMNIDPSRIRQIGTGFMASEVLLSAVEIT